MCQIFCSIIQGLWRNEEDCQTESLPSQSFSFKTYTMYATAIFTHVVLELRKNKSLQYWFKATLTLETRIGYICNNHGFQGEICDGLEA